MTDDDVLAALIESREAALQAQVAALREALEELHKWNHGLAYVGVPDSWKLADATLADTAAAAQAHDASVRADEREACAKVAETALLPPDGQLPEGLAGGIADLSMRLIAAAIRAMKPEER